MTSEQRPPVNNGQYFWVPKVVAVDRFNCMLVIRWFTADCKKKFKVSSFEVNAFEVNVFEVGIKNVLKFRKKRGHINKFSESKMKRISFSQQLSTLHRKSRY